MAAVEVATDENAVNWEMGKVFSLIKAALANVALEIGGGSSATG